MKKRNPFIALTAAGLAASTLLTACGTPAPSSSQQTTGSEASTETAEPVSLDSITFMSKDYYTDLDFADKFMDLFEADTGVGLEIVQIPNNGWEDKVTASFMSGELPDVARMPTELYPFVKQDLLLPLDEYIENNPTIKQIIEDNPGSVEAFTYFDQIYAISISNAKYMTIWVRQDWLDKLGMEMPDTLDEFVEMLRAFRDSDLDGDGVNDTIPLTLPASLQPMDTIAAYFNTRNEVYVKDGKPIIPYRTEEYKEFMEFMKSLYDEGLIDKETPTNTSYGNIRNKFNVGDAGAIIMWDDSSSSLINGMASSGVEGEVVYMPAFKNEEGTGALGLSYYLADSPVSLTTGCENPQAVFDTFFNWMLASDNGIVATSAGLEGYSFDIVDGVMVPNVDNGGMGFHGQSFPPVDMDYEYPYQFDETYQYKYDCIAGLAEDGKAMGELSNTTFIAPDNTQYNDLKGDLDAKMQELFHNYLVGNIDYDTYLSSFEAYAAEIDLDNIVAGNS